VKKPALYNFFKNPEEFFGPKTKKDIFGILEYNSRKIKKE
jgi:hypothetical protein